MTLVHNQTTRQNITPNFLFALRKPFREHGTNEQFDWLIQILKIILLDVY